MGKQIKSNTLESLEQSEDPSYIELEDRTKVVTELMESRGYKKTATGTNGESLFFLKKIDDVITVHAFSRVRRLTVELDIIGTLDMGVKLATEAIVIDSNAFDKTEEALINYGKTLLQVHRESNDSYDDAKPVQKGRNIDAEKKVEKTIDERKKEFWEKIRQVGKQKSYEKEMCIEFYEYWTQKNEQGKKMRFEKEATWDLSGRLRTWCRNDKEWSKRYANIQEKKAEKQDVELAQTGTKHISTKDLF